MELCTHAARIKDSLRLKEICIVISKMTQNKKKLPQKTKGSNFIGNFITYWLVLGLPFSALIILRTIMNHFQYI
jgi:hypothetical protein